MSDEKKKQPVMVDAVRVARPTSPPTPGSLAIWLVVESMVDAVPAELVVTPRIDLQAVAVTALGVTGELSDDAGLLARFAAVAAIGEIEPEIVEKVSRLAGAAWYARHRQMQAEFADSDAAVPEHLVTAGEELVGRMLKLAQYQFEGNATEWPVVQGVVPTRGHSRLANNLLTLSELYRRQPTVVASDAKNYRATDERDARKISEGIVAALAEGSASEAELWKGRSARIWTLLSRAYGDMQQLGRYFLRANPEAAAERFPSLVAEVRSAPTPRKAATPIATPTDGVHPPPSPQDATIAAAPAKSRRRRTR